MPQSKIQSQRRKNVSAPGLCDCCSDLVYCGALKRDSVLCWKSTGLTFWKLGCWLQFLCYLVLSWACLLTSWSFSAIRWEPHHLPTSPGMHASQFYKMWSFMSSGHRKMNKIQPPYQRHYSKCKVLMGMMGLEKVESCIYKELWGFIIIIIIICFF